MKKLISNMYRCLFSLVLITVVVFGTAFGSGWHYPHEIIGGVFDKDYSFNGTIDFTDATVIGLGAGSGTITGVDSGVGLIGGGDSGDVLLGVNFSYVQRRVIGVCGVNQSIRLINSDGSVVCQAVNISGSFSESDPIYSSSTASSIASANISNWNTAYGWGNHASAGYLTSFTEVGDISSVTAGSGLTGGGTTGDVTLNVASHAGTVGSIGTVNVGADTIGVNLGTTSTTAYRGDYGNVAYTQRLRWDGGATGLVAGTGRTSLGASTVGSNIFTMTNPGAVSFLRFNADNSVSALDAATFRTAIGAGTGIGTITGVVTGIGTCATGSCDLRSYDGTGSGLDADSLDGINGASFLRSDVSDAFNGGILQVYSGAGNDVTTASSLNGLQIFQPTAGADALITFHVGGDYALHFGLDGDTNDLTVGGWSMGAIKYKVWHEGNDGAGSGLDADTVDGINSASFLRSDVDYSLTAAIVVPTGNRDEGMFGTYDSTKTQHIWSMGTAYRNDAAGTNFGNLYGLAYKHTNNPTGGTLAGGHQMVWVQNGNPTSAMGSGIWTSGAFYGAGTGLTGTAASLTAGSVTTPSGTYKHLGAWGVGRTAPGAILVNTAYTADYATNAGYATTAGNVAITCPCGTCWATVLDTSNCNNNYRKMCTPTGWKQTSSEGSNCRSCFTAGAMVLMANGSYKQIEDVQVGEKVKGLNQDNVVLAYDYPIMPALAEQKLVSINGMDYFITNNHPIMTTEGWKAVVGGWFAEREDYDVLEGKVTNLELGDEIILSNGSTMIVESIYERLDFKPVKLYNFVLAGDNTYYVNDILVNGFRPDSKNRFHIEADHGPYKKDHK